VPGVLFPKTKLTALESAETWVAFALGSPARSRTRLSGESVRSTPGQKTRFPARQRRRWSATRYFGFSFFRMRRSSMKQSPDVVQRTQPIMMITFMSIAAGSLSRLCPATASDLYTHRNCPVRKIQQKAHPDCCHSSFTTGRFELQLNAQNRPAARYNNFSCPDIPLWSPCTMSRRT